MGADRVYGGRPNGGRGHDFPPLLDATLANDDLVPRAQPIKKAEWGAGGRPMAGDGGHPGGTGGDIPQVVGRGDLPHAVSLEEGGVPPQQRLGLKGVDDDPHPDLWDLQQVPFGARLDDWSWDRGESCRTVQFSPPVHIAFTGARDIVIEAADERGGTYREREAADDEP